MESSDLSFDDEAQLREALLGLLTRMEAVTGTLHLHGKLERGKDIVFVTRGPFNEPVVTALVVKNNRISGNIASGTSAFTVWGQIEQALENPYTTRQDKRNALDAYTLLLLSK